MENPKIGAFYATSMVTFLLISAKEDFVPILKGILSSFIGCIPNGYTKKFPWSAHANICNFTTKIIEWRCPWRSNAITIQHSNDI